MDILICGVPRSGNVLLRNIVIEMLGQAGQDYYAEEHYQELDQRVFLFVRRWLRTIGIRSPHIPRGGYVYRNGLPILRSRHRLSEQDFLFISAPLSEQPNERIVPTHALPEDLPRAAQLFCTMRNPEQVIDSTLNFVFPDMQHYMDAREVTAKDFYLYRWANLDVFERTIRRIMRHYHSFLEHKDKFLVVPYEQLLAEPTPLLCTIADALNIDSSEKLAQQVWEKVSFRGLMGKWKFHYRKDRNRYFKLREFLTADHLAIVERHEVNQITLALGYGEERCYTEQDIAITSRNRVKMELPHHFQSLGTIEEKADNAEITVGDLRLRYRGPRLKAAQMTGLAGDVAAYLAGGRSDIEGKKVLLYGGGSLGRYVWDQLQNRADIIGFIENDDFSVMKRSSVDAVVICSIQHELVMEDKLKDQGIADDAILAWYDVT